MSKKELLKALRKCKEVKVVCHIHQHFCMYVKAVKADVRWNINYETKDMKPEEVYAVQMLSDDTLLIG
ncbi:MAG: hypothetical protein QQN41_04070 [Nitrosopumilus sp.]